VVCGFNHCLAKRAAIPTCQSVGNPYSILEYESRKEFALRGGARLPNRSKLWGFNPPNELGLVGR
jgi:hypothetical protein